jgi:hypothetical protein
VCDRLEAITLSIRWGCGSAGSRRVSRRHGPGGILPAVPSIINPYTKGSGSPRSHGGEYADDGGVCLPCHFGRQPFIFRRSTENENGTFEDHCNVMRLRLKATASIFGCQVTLERCGVWPKVCLPACVREKEGEGERMRQRERENTPYSIFSSTGIA